MGKIEEMNARVRAWGAGLDRRAREWVNLHPEKPEKPEKPQKLIESAPAANFRVTITESTTAPGAWSVYVNNTKYHTFFGRDAHELAMEFMKNLLDKNQ